jgi:hypothetical protein
MDGDDGLEAGGGVGAVYDFLVTPVSEYLEYAHG